LQRPTENVVTSNMLPGIHVLIVAGVTDNFAECSHLPSLSHSFPWSGAEVSTGTVLPASASVGKHPL